MKNKEELNALKAEYESLNKKLGELTDDEKEQVTGNMCDKSAALSEEGMKQVTGGCIIGLPGLP